MQLGLFWYVMNLSTIIYDYISETGFIFLKGGVSVTEFERLLEESMTAVERYVKYKIAVSADAEDVLQDVFLTAYQGFDGLRHKDSFKVWIVGIARNKCFDYYRKKAKRAEISIDVIPESALTVGNRRYCGENTQTNAEHHNATQKNNHEQYFFSVLVSNRVRNMY